MKNFAQKVTRSRLFGMILAFGLIISMTAVSPISAHAAEITTDDTIVYNNGNNEIVPLAYGDTIASKVGTVKPGERFSLTFKINNLFGQKVAICAGSQSPNGSSGTISVRFKATNTKLNIGTTKVLWTIDLPYGEHTVYIENVSSTCACAISIMEM